MALSDTTIRNTQPKEKMFRLSDGEGLYLEVYPNGRKLWRIRYKRQGKETMLSLGAYPTVTLKEARNKRNEINVQRASGLDPVQERRKTVSLAEGAGLTFGAVYEEWLAKHQPPVWSQKYYDKTVIRARKHIVPYISSKNICDLTAPDVLAILRPIEARGHHGTAHRILGICSQVFRYAVAIGVVTSDPCRDLRGALTPAVVEHYAAITDPLAVGRLLLDIDSYFGTKTVQCALRLAPLVFIRPTELRAAAWSEIDLEGREWRIPAARMKMAEQHIVPLSRQAYEILLELHPMTGHGKYLFPSIRSGNRCMSDATLSAALKRMGYSGDKMTWHGFRAMASTLLNEMGWNMDYIERQLAHAERNKSRAAYNRALYLKERKEMMQAWADHLDFLRDRARSAEQRS